MTPRRRAKILLTSAAVALGAMVFALAAGPDGISFDWLDDEAARSSLLMVRGPRVVLSALAGAALATSGAALQALLRNPLADPYVIGVSGGAALGGALAIALPVGAAVGSSVADAGLVDRLLSAGGVEAGAVLGALGATALLGWFLARDRGRGDATLLAGVVFNAFASALITLMKTVLPAEKTQSLLFWLVGSVDYVPWRSVVVVAVPVVLGIAVLVHHAGALELLSLGAVEAERLGLDAKRARIVTYLAGSLLVGAVVPVTGLIGFVGLVVPHAVRLTISADRRVLVPACALLGAAALALFDAASRLSFAVVGTELPTGALTALVGAPVFAFALVRHVRLGGTQ